MLRKQTLNESINSPIRSSSATAIPTSFPPRPGPLLTWKTISARSRQFLSAWVVCFCLLVPAPAGAFDFGKAFKDAADSVKQHVTDLTQKKVDEGEKKVEEGIDQVFEGESTATQPETSGQHASQQERQTVMEVQQRLNALGYNAGPADGMLGSKSVTAIKAYQRDHGMAETGRVSPELITALEPMGGGQNTGLSSTPASGSAVPGAQSPPSTTEVAIGPVKFTGFHNGVLGFRFLPELYMSDGVLAHLTERQIQMETQKWEEFDSRKVNRNHDGEVIGTIDIPTFTFSWEDGKRDPRIREAIIHNYLAGDADWSFLSDYGYEGRLDSIVQLFLLKRESHQNRMPEIVAQELIPVYRDFVKTAVASLPTIYYLRRSVGLRYDMQSSEMIFSYGNDTPRLTEKIVGYFGASLPPATGGTGSLLPTTLEGYAYLPYGLAPQLSKTPTNMPGFYGGRNEQSSLGARWRETMVSFGGSSGKPSIGLPRLALDRPLILTPVKMDPSRAEKILLALKANPNPWIEIRFEVTGAAAGKSFVRGESMGQFAVLLGEVVNVGILDGKGNPLFDVSTPSGKTLLQEKEEQQAEAAAQAEAQERQKASETETEKQRLEKLRMACYTGEPYPWEATSACLDAAKAKVPKDSSGSIRPGGWEFLNAIEDDQRRILLPKNAFQYELGQACSIGAMRKQRSAGPGAGSSQDLQKECQENSRLALNAEKVCPASGPLNKDAQNCLHSHVEALVNKHYGFAGNQ